MKTSKHPEKQRPRASIQERDPLIDGLGNLTVSFKNLVKSTSQAEASLRTENKGLRKESDDLRNERHSLRNERDSQRTEKDNLRLERDGLRKERDHLSMENELLRRELNDRPMHGSVKRTESNTARVGLGDKRKIGNGHEKPAQDK
ncbi:hypothetical protein KC332_g3454 [Hortaea werneckii]|nr:hypothetical protein KC358_g6422 [Hortaea werneckii]KAI6846585.1 hypothetical protein KC350_g3871 [Hortaea werneckii]KAI6933582.1 hypothetical protein KC348_g6704 [Hortaea werneckii]KAI6937042.1 hypothetical protein KC341_g5837 [Hortaea werneckii]KAI6977455.1 hypothetical protein KC321_g3441 [Hortaea werneckii]